MFIYFFYPSPVFGETQFPHEQYIRNYTFGKPYIGPPELDRVKLKFSATDENGKYSNIKAKVILKEAYDIQYGLYNHDDLSLSHPFQLQMWTEKKSIKRYGLMREYMRRYHIHQIHKYTGLNFIEFIQMPIDWVEDCFTITNDLSEEDIRRMNAHQSSEMKEMQDVEKGMNSMGTLRFDGGFGQ